MRFLGIEENNCGAFHHAVFSGEVQFKQGDIWFDPRTTFTTMDDPAIFDSVTIDEAVEGAIQYLYDRTDEFPDCPFRGRVWEQEWCEDGNCGFDSDDAMHYVEVYPREGTLPLRAAYFPQEVPWCNRVVVYVNEHDDPDVALDAVREEWRNGHTPLPDFQIVVKREEE